MALIKVNYFSNALRRSTTFNLILPNDVPPMMTAENPHYRRGMKTLFLLHGYSGYCDDWLTGSNISELAGKYNIAVVMPSGENSFYLNHKGAGSKYEQLVGEEIVSYVRTTFGIAKNKEDTFINGLSMGGFGAIRTGLKFPEVFGKIAGLSSALIISDIAGMQDGFDNGFADYDYYFKVFGDLDLVATSENNPEVLIKNRLAQKEQIQPIYIACGTEDFLIEHNRNFRQFLKDNGVQVDYFESPGMHDWKFWQEYLEPSILWFLKD